MCSLRTTVRSGSSGSEVRSRTSGSEVSRGCLCLTSGRGYLCPRSDGSEVRRGIPGVNHLGPRSGRGHLSPISHGYIGDVWVLGPDGVVFRPRVQGLRSVRKYKGPRSR